MLIATGRLVAGMTGDNPADHYKLVEDKRIYVGTRIEYAKYVNEKRDIVRLGRDTVVMIQNRWKDYIQRGK